MLQNSIKDDYLPYFPDDKLPLSSYEVQVTQFSWAPVILRDCSLTSSSSSSSCLSTSTNIVVASLKENETWSLNVSLSQVRFNPARWMLMNNNNIFHHQQKVSSTLSTSPNNKKQQVQYDDNKLNGVDDANCYNDDDCDDDDNILSASSSSLSLLTPSSYVEVLMPCEIYPPFIWEVAKVEQVKHGTFFFLYFLSKQTTRILESPIMRAVNKSVTLSKMNFDSIQEAVIQIPSAIQQSSEKWKELVNQTIFAKTAVLFTIEESDNDKESVINLFGDSTSLKMAKLLLENEISENIEFQARRNRRLKILEGRRTKNEAAELIEFSANDSLVGLVIGKQGDNLSRVAKTCRVEIHVLPDEKGSRRIRIYGTDKQQVGKAKKELEHLFCQIPLPDYATGFRKWLLSTEAEQAVVREHGGWASVHSIWYEFQTNCLIICGLQKGIDDACNLLHEEYEKYKEKNLRRGSNWNNSDNGNNNDSIN